MLMLGLRLNSTVCVFTNGVISNKGRGGKMPTLD